MADASWPPGLSVSRFIPVQQQRARSSQPVQQHRSRSSLQGPKRIVPKLPLHALKKAIQSASLGTDSNVSVLQPDPTSAKQFLDSVLQGSRRTTDSSSRRPPRSSEAWKKNMVFSKMDWDSLASSPRISSKFSTQRTSGTIRPDGKRKIGRTMAPSMFATTDAKNIENLFEHHASYVDKFRKAAPPSRTVPSSFPGYRLHRRIQGTWAYQPPDTRQDALNAWFVKRMKRPPPSIEKVHVAFGRTTYPFQFSTRKKKPGAEVPEPVVEVPKMTLTPRKSSVKPLES